MSGYPFCPPPSPNPCPQVCPRPPLPPCLVKPVMRRLHLSQTKRVLAQVLILCTISGSCVYFFLGQPRRERYRQFYAKSEFEDWADEMARKGLFQSVPIKASKD